MMLVSLLKKSCRVSAFRWPHLSSVVNAEKLQAASDLKFYVLSGISRFSNQQDVSSLVDGIAGIRNVEAILDEALIPMGDWVAAIETEGAVEQLSQRVKSSSFKFIAIENTKYSHLRLPNKFQISNKSIRIKDSFNVLNEDILAFVFENYRLSVPNPTFRIGNDFIVNFLSAEEAERASIEKQGCFINGVSMGVFWYNI